MIRDASQIAGVCQATNSGRRPTAADDQQRQLSNRGKQPVEAQLAVVGRLTANRSHGGATI